MHLGGINLLTLLSEI